MTFVYCVSGYLIGVMAFCLGTEYSTYKSSSKLILLKRCCCHYLINAPTKYCINENFDLQKPEYEKEPGNVCKRVGQESSALRLY